MRTTISVLCAAIAAVSLAACGPDPGDDLAPGADVDRYPGGTDAATGAEPVGAGPAQRPAGTADSSLAVATGSGAGAHVATSAGSALYYVEGDTDGSACTGECTRAWPPMLAGDTMPSASAGLEAGMIGTITRGEGSRQVTYNGRPLYRYAADTGAGTTAGHGVQDQWGHWYLVGPDGAPLPHE